jgi:alcohol dehydrogenase
MFLSSYFEFSSPVKVVAGHHALEHLNTVLAEMETSRPMIVTDKGVATAGLVQLVSEKLTPPLEIGSVADDVPPDSEIEVVNRIAEQYRGNRCDGLIAIGGGSVLDTAKGVNILVSECGNDLTRFAGKGMLQRPLKPLVAIPTTGSGSEVTMAAVIKDKKKKAKRIFVSEFLVPRIAILDPRMTLTLPPTITAATAMDALCHAMESYFCRAKNPISDSHAIAAIEMTRDHLLSAMANPQDSEARLALAIAASLAGSAFSNSMVGMVHAISHALGTICGVPHGVGNAIMLPYGLEYNLHKRSQEIGELLLPLAGPEIYFDTPAHLRAKQTIAAVRQLNQRLHESTGGRHPQSLKEIVDRQGNGLVTKDHMDDIARKSIGDGAMFYNPEEMDHDDCILVLKCALEGIALDNKLVYKG